MFDHHKQKALLLFAAADVILTVLAFEAAYQTRLLLPLPQVFFIPTPVKALLLGYTLLLWLVLGRWIRAYSGLSVSDTRAALYDTLRQVGFGALGIAAFLFALNLDISRLFLGLFLLYNIILLVVYRAAAGRLRGWIRRQFGAEFYYVVVGEGPLAVELARHLEEAKDFGVKLLAYVDLSGSLEGELQLTRSYPIRRLTDLPAMLRHHIVDEILFAVDTARLASLEEVFLACDEEGVRTRVAANFFPHVNSRISLGRFGELPLLTFSATPNDDVRLLAKRVFDVTFAALSLLLLAVPMAALAVLVRLSSPGPALFRQTRCGLNGRRFTLSKFRSMVSNAEGLRPGLRHLNEKDGPVFKIARDPRLTRLGRFLRRYSIDEWPQFWSVLKGDMSLVGPRPATPDEVETYLPWQRRRLRMRPGLTCLWAIRGRDHVDFETWMRHDLEYIDNWSLWLDLKILLHSIPLVLAGRGAH